MYTDMDWWTKVRLEVLRGEKSKREVLRDEGIHWETLKKILEHSEPPGYRLKEARPKPKIGPYLERIAQIIEQDKALPKKQRHTAKRIYERIREMGYGGKYTQVKTAVRELVRIKQEVFMPLIHRPGEGQVDFGYALAKVAGARGMQKALEVLKEPGEEGRVIEWPDFVSMLEQLTALMGPSHAGELEKRFTGKNDPKQTGN